MCHTISPLPFTRQMQGCAELTVVHLRSEEGTRRRVASLDRLTRVSHHIANREHTCSFDITPPGYKMRRERHWYPAVSSRYEHS